MINKISMVTPNYRSKIQFGKSIKRKENSQRKEGLSTTAQVSIGAALALALLVGADFVFDKGRHVKSIFGKASETAKKEESKVQECNSEIVSPKTTDIPKSETPKTNPDKSEKVQNVVINHTENLKDNNANTEIKIDQQIPKKNENIVSPERIPQNKKRMTLDELLATESGRVKENEDFLGNSEFKEKVSLNPFESDAKKAEEELQKKNKKLEEEEENTFNNTLADAVIFEDMMSHDSSLVDDMAHHTAFDFDNPGEVDMIDDISSHIDDMDMSDGFDDMF